MIGKQSSNLPQESANSPFYDSLDKSKNGVRPFGSDADEDVVIKDSGMSSLVQSLLD